MIAGAIAGIMMRNADTYPALFMPAAIVCMVGILIGFYIDYNANYHHRDDEPVMVRSIVFNVLSVVGGFILTIGLIILGGI